MPKENNSNNYVSTKNKKIKERGERKRKKKGRERNQGKRKKALSDRSDDVHTRPGYHRRVCDRFSFQNISLERSGHNPREVSLCTETVHHRLCRHSPRNRLHSPHWQKSKLSAPRSSSSNRRRQRLGKPAWNRAQ